jgi:dihydroneopterin aldolase
MKVVEAKLFLRNFSADAEIGVHEFELQRTQRVLISIDMAIDTGLNFSADKIDETVDYDFLRGGIHRLIEGRRYNTQEALCFDILQFVLKKGHVKEAVVTTQKPDVYPDSEAVGCTMRGAV